MHGHRTVLTGLLGAVLLVATLSSCTQGGDQAPPATSSAAGTLVATGTVPTVANDLASNSAHHSLEVPGEQFGLLVDYWTGYDAGAWQTLQPKDVNLSVHLVPAATATGDPPEVLISSFDGVTTLLAALPGLDGLPIAQTHESPTAVPGYLISATYPFDNRLGIEGFSDSLQARWQTLAGDEPLTEPALVTAGTYGNRMSFSYRIAVRNNGDAGYHQRVVQDTLTVPEAGQPVPAAGSAAPLSVPTTTG